MRKPSLAGALDTRTYTIINVIWTFEQHDVEATYNKLYKMVNKIEKMPRQSFQNRLSFLINEGLITKTIQEKSRLTYKPRVYKLTKKGRTVASLNWGLLTLKKNLIEEAKTIPLTEMFSFFLTKMYLTTACSPLFLFLGHGEFINFFAYDMMNIWTSIVKEKTTTNPGELLKIIPQAIAITTIITNTPLPDSTVEDIKERIRQAGVNPDDIFLLAEKYKKGVTSAWAEFEKKLQKPRC